MPGEGDGIRPPQLKRDYQTSGGGGKSVCHQSYMPILVVSRLGIHPLRGSNPRRVELEGRLEAWQDGNLKVSRAGCSALPRAFGKRVLKSTAIKKRAVFIQNKTVRIIY